VQRPPALLERALVVGDAADQHVDAARHLHGEILQRRVVGAPEARAQQQVFGRIAADRELREDRELGAAGERAARELRHLRDVAGEVADRRVDLAKGNLHRSPPIAVTALRAAG
jgi:hypothetical protein